MSVKSDVSHLFAVVRLRGTGVWTGESVQYGLRLGVTFGDQIPSLGTGRWELPVHDIFVEEQAGTHGVLNVQRGFREAAGSTAYSATFQDAVATAVLGPHLATRSNISNLYEFQDLRLYPTLASGRLPTDTWPTIYTPSDNSYHGVSTADLMPPSAAICVSWSSALRTRKGRGRIFTGAWTTNGLSAGRVSGTRMTQLRDAWVTALQNLRAIGTGAGAATAVPVIWTRGGLDASVINRVRVNNEWDTQRSRERQQVITWVEGALV